MRFNIIAQTWPEINPEGEPQRQLRDKLSPLAGKATVTSSVRGWLHEDFNKRRDDPWLLTGETPTTVLHVLSVNTAVTLTISGGKHF